MELVVESKQILYYSEQTTNNCKVTPARSERGISEFDPGSAVTFTLVKFKLALKIATIHSLP